MIEALIAILALFFFIYANYQTASQMLLILVGLMGMQQLGEVKNE